MASLCHILRRLFGYLDRIDTHSCHAVIPSLSVDLSAKHYLLLLVVPLHLDYMFSAAINCSTLHLSSLLLTCLSVLLGLVVTGVDCGGNLLLEYLLQLVPFFHAGIFLSNLILYSWCLP